MTLEKRFTKLHRLDQNAIDLNVKRDDLQRRDVATTIAEARDTAKARERAATNLHFSKVGYR